MQDIETETNETLEQAGSALNAVAGNLSSLMANLPYYKNVSEIDISVIQSVLREARSAQQRIHLLMRRRTNDQN